MLPAPNAWSAAAAALLTTIALGTSCAPSRTSVAATLPDDLSSQTGRAYAVEAIDAHVRRYFAHWEGAPGLDYDAALTEFRQTGAAVGSRREFTFAAMRFMAILENGHTDVSDSRLWEELGAALPFTLRHTEGRWAVASSRDDRIAPGSVVSTIDGQSFEEFFQEVRPFLSASSEHWERRLLGARPFLFPESFILTFADGSDAEVERVRPSANPAAAGSRAVTERVPHRWVGDGNTALMRLATFGTQEVEDRALQLLDSEIGRASAIVLDLRGNGGGNTPWKLRKALLRGRGGHDWQWTVIEERTTPSLLMRVVAPIVVRLYSPPRWEGPLVLLVDAGCFSACEDLVGSLRGAPGVRVVGKTTGGSTGQPVFLSLDEGFDVRVSARRVALPDGTPFEGRGIRPDVPIARGIDDYRTGADPMLEAAIEEAGKIAWRRSSAQHRSGDAVGSFNPGETRRGA